MPIKQEHKGRTWTPLSIALLTVCVSAGFGFIGWCGDSAVRVFTSHFDSIEKKQDIMFKTLTAIKDKENSDVLCLTKSVYKCCGEKADANC